MANLATDTDAEHAAAARRRYLIRFEEDTLRQRPLWIRLIIEFLGTFVLVTVTAAAIAALFLVFWGTPTWVTALVIAIVLLVVLGLIQLIGAPPATPQAKALG